MRSKAAFFAMIMLALGLTVFTTLSEGTFSFAREELAEVGYYAPSFKLTTMANDTYQLTHRLEKPLVLNFWASWCGPCQLEAPHLAELHQTYGDELNIVAVNLTSHDHYPTAQKFVERFGLDFPIPLDIEGQIGETYGIPSIPTTFFIAPDGKIMDKIIGYEPNTLEAKIEELLNNISK